MKLLKNISILLLFLLTYSGAIAQQQCSIRLTDATPSAGQYKANLYVIYNGAVESYQLNKNVTLNATTDIPFNLNNDVEDNLYRIVVYIQEPGSPLPPLAGPYFSLLFNTSFWTYNNINVSANLP
ncbi:MAG: hypothetical protein WCP32_16590 [Bacteroidota bacterium]